MPDERPRRSGLDETRRIVLSLVMVIGAGAVLAAPVVGQGRADARSPRTTEDPRSPRPDIVVFMLDDIPKLDGRLLGALPNIRRVFIEQGVEFTDFHGETPTCCPGRAGFLTGLHTHHHGIVKNDGTLFKPTMTIATQLRRAGYYTIGVGKYLNKFERIADKWPPGWSRFHAFGGGYYDYSLWHDGRQQRYGRAPRDYSTDVISRLTLRAIRDAPRRKRIFAWITPYSFHEPWQVAPRHIGAARCADVRRWRPPNYMEQNLRDKPRYLRRVTIKARAGYPLTQTCRGLLSVDEMIGKVERRLKAQGRWSNTLLILTSDNGMNFGSHRVLLDKKTPYATQLPFYLRWPRLHGTSAGSVTERLQNIDLAPTLCDIARCRLGPYPTGQRHPDGISFLPLITGEQSGLAREAVLSSYRDKGHWVPPWWSITTTARSGLADQGCDAGASSGCRWLFVQYSTGERELYDTSNGPCWRWHRSDGGDPCMLRNLAGNAAYRGIERQLARRLMTLR